MRNKVRNGMRNRIDDARNSLILKFIIILVVSLLVYALFISYSFYSNLIDDNYENIESAINMSIENLSQTLDMMRSTTYALSGSESIGEWRNDQEYFNGNSKQVYLNHQKLNEEMQRILTYNNTWNFDIFDYITIYEDSDLLAITYTKPYSLQQIINATSNIQKRISIEQDYSLMLSPHEGNNSIYTTLRIQADFTKDDSLYIIGATNVEKFNENLNSLVNYEGTLVYLVDSNGRIYASNNGENLGGVFDLSLIEQPTERNTHKINDIYYEVIKKKINKEFYLVYMLPKAEVVKQTLVDMRTFIVLSVLISVVLTVFATFSILKVTRVVKELVLAMRKVSNKDYDVRIGHFGNPAYDELGDSFNSMVEKLKELIQITYESKILLNEMQIKSLQQQMNPHFLFNILLTIQIKAKMSGDETVYKMIASLSALLRAGIYGDKRMTISIGEEIKYVEYYLSLQKERYEERLKYKIEIFDETILQCEIPRLALEPIVENAVVHGIEGMSEGGEVDVILKIENNDIRIIVKDNGVGFNVEEYMKTKLVENIDHTIHEKTGLASTNKRIQLLYGSPYGVNIVSDVNGGTEVNILIPMKIL